jgi:hypothetical protein
MSEVIYLKERRKIMELEQISKTAREERTKELYTRHKYAHKIARTPNKTLMKRTRVVLFGIHKLEAEVALKLRHRHAEETQQWLGGMAAAIDIVKKLHEQAAAGTLTKLEDEMREELADIRANDIKLLK